MLDTYEEIELFGLTEHGTDDLPIPDVDELRHHAVLEAFEALIGTLQGTGLGSEIEPLAHGLATLLGRHARKLGDQADRTRQKLTALIGCQDGSEIAEAELESAQQSFQILWEKHLALEAMAEAAATAYEQQTGEAYIPVTGGRTSQDARATGAVFEAKELLAAHDRAEAERNSVQGTKIAVSGSTKWDDIDAVYKTLDRVHRKYPDMIVCHKGGKNGAEKIAATWARNRQVPQILFRPNWAGHGKAAPFKANDAIIEARPVGVVLFGGEGVALNLRDKAEVKKIRVMMQEVTA